ncbi:uncharacterized protein LOC127805540 [Diospyros lotus]|uniref:uncharacterized protein LOC127805540 n=1 Tax=Diospyros lotus TaxID=55363 RepID=UPI00225BBD04|nr:uncharacterized protein LOC127805540 [Diospyros lotus]
MAAPNNNVPMATASASAAVGPPVSKPATHVEKPQQFNGEDFKRWQQKMVFYLTTLNLAHILKEACPVTPENATAKEVAAKEALMHTDFLCQNYILSALVDSLYNVYCTAYPTAKDLWDALDKKYKLEDAGTKKFLVGKFLDYKMVDSKLVVNQLEELQVLFSDLLSEGLVINEPFQVAAVIEKLPPSWKDFKNYLKHKRKELSMEDLAVRLRIEEDNRKGDKAPLRMEARANVVEASKTQPKKQQGKKKNVNMGPKNKTPTKRIQGTC